MTAIRSAIASLVAAAHNLWAKLPTAVQAALIVIAFAAYTFTAAYNWTLPAGFIALDPATWHLMFTVGAAFVVALWAVLYPLIVGKLWPALVPWLLSLLALVVQTTPEPNVAKAYPQMTQKPIRLLWTKGN